MEENNDCKGCGQPMHATEQLNFANNNSIKSRECKGCAGNKFSGKLGSCQQCMYTAFFGMVFGWATYLIVFFLDKEKNIKIAALGVATFFTLLLLAHGIAYLIKKGRKINEK